MTSKERFNASVQYKTPDRPPLSPLYTQPYVYEKLCAYLGVKTYEEFQLITGVDFRFAGPAYIGPEFKKFEDGSYEGIWGERYKRLPFPGGTYEEPVYQPFKDIEDVKALDGMRFPTADWFDYSGVEAQCRKIKDYAIITGGAGHFDFMNGIGFIRGIGQVYLDIGLEDEVYLEIVERRFKFHYEMLRRTLEAANGLIDIVYCGEDLGTQQAPVISPDKFSRLFEDKYRRLFSMAHSYGAKTMMHSCGSMRVFIPKLIEIGLDILDAVQVDAAGMDIRSLHADFYKKIVFCGSMSVQSILPKFTPEQVADEVRLRMELFKEGGIFIGPANVMQGDMPPENFVAMCRTLGSMK